MGRNFLLRMERYFETRFDNIYRIFNYFQQLESLY